MKFYVKGEEIPKEKVLEKSRNEEILVSFDDGKTIVSTYKDVNALSKLMDEGILEFSYLPWDKQWFFTNITQSDTEVSEEVLDYLADIAHKKKMKLDYDGALSLVNHLSVLKWLLKKGAKCKHIRGRGMSTMENFFRKKEHNDPIADDMIALLKEYKAIDYGYLEMLKKEQGTRNLWSASTAAAFFDIIVYIGDRELRFNGSSIAVLPLDKDVYISFDNGKTKLSLSREPKAMGKAFKERVIEYNIIPHAPAYPFVSMLSSTTEVSSQVLDILKREAKKANVQLDLEKLSEKAVHESVKKWFEKNK